MTKEEAEKEIQARLSKMLSDFEEVRKIADEHFIEFSFLGNSMHYRDAYWYPGKKARDGRPDRLAKTGFFIADEIWQSSGMNCGPQEDAANGQSYYQWDKANWPEDYDDDDEDS